MRKTFIFTDHTLTKLCTNFVKRDIQKFSTWYTIYFQTLVFPARVPKPSANVRHTKPTATRRLLSNEYSRTGVCGDAGGGAGERRGTAAGGRPRGAGTAPKPYDLTSHSPNQKQPQILRNRVPYRTTTTWSANRCSWNRTTDLSASAPVTWPKRP